MKNKVHQGERIAVVVSARGKATDDLEAILEKAVKNEAYLEQLEAFKNYQKEASNQVDFSTEFLTLDKLFKGVKLLGDYSKKTKDEVLAQGEILSIKLIEQLLKEKGIKANATDARLLIKTDENFGDAQPLTKLSKENVINYFEKYNGKTVKYSNWIYCIKYQE